MSENSVAVMPLVAASTSWNQLSKEPKSSLAERQCEEIKGGGNIAIRADIDPKTFADWCNGHGFKADSQSRTAFVNHVELEYRKTGKGTVIE